jgi:hypothetical protein
MWARRPRSANDADLAVTVLPRGRRDNLRAGFLVICLALDRADYVLSKLWE